ncbi:MAG: oligosaccharide flippase family protein [Phycisphaerae bacterium]|nr:oligosaccharide flippase family protein [Phycisphaerae bacterium]
MSVGVQSTQPGAPRRLSLRRNFSWTFVGNLTYTVARWVMLMVLAKLGDASAVGIYALGLSVCAPIEFLTSLHLRPALVTDTKHEYTYGQYIGLRLASATMTMILAAVAALVFLRRDTLETRLVVIILGVGTAIFGVREIFMGISEKNERMDVSGQSQMLLSVVALVAFTVAFLLSRSVVWAALSLVVARLTVLLAHDIPRARTVVAQHVHPGESLSFRPDWSRAMLGRLFLRVWPLGLAMAIGSFTNNTQHYFLKGYHGDASLGYYGAIVALTQGATILMNTLGIAASPRLAQVYVSNRRGFYRLFLRLLGIALGLGLAFTLGAALFGEWILSLVFTPEYAQYADELVWLAIATTFMFAASMMSTTLTATRAFVAQLCVWFVVAPLTVLVSWLLVPTFGVQGAVWGRTASMLILLIAITTSLFTVLRRAARDQARMVRPDVNAPETEP